MGCFVVPAIIGIVNLFFRKKFPANWHIEWLNAMLLGGSGMLLIDHVASGEVVPFFPFFTAMSTPQGIAFMLREMAFIGVPMAIAAVGIWMAAVVITNRSAVPSGQIGRLHA